MAWLRARAGWLVALAFLGGWASVEHCRAEATAEELAAARAEVVLRDLQLVDQEARYEADRTLFEERAHIVAERAAADARAAAEARAQIELIEEDEVARRTAAEAGALSDEVNRRIDKGLLPGGTP